ncbi:MAG: DUF885 family protein [Bacillota bacterium]|nr:DUF885 family protein [Bacillota bacterium]
MKKLIVLLCALTMCLNGCTYKTTTTQTTSTEKQVEAIPKNEDYAAFLDALFIEELENDYNTFHTYVQNEADFGINRKNIEVTLGEFLADYSEKEESRDQANLEKLQSYDYESLSDEEKVIYDQIIYTYDLNKKFSDEKFKYLDCVWSGTSSSSTSLYNLFMEYSFYSKQDIEDCITLINDVPRYLNEVMDYTEEQANKGLLMIDYDNVVKGVNDIIQSKGSKNILNALSKAMDSLNLSKEEKKDYSKRIEKALEENFYPSYQTVLNRLSKVKSKIKSHTGLANLDNGKEYYQTLLQYYTGTNDNPEDIRNKLKSVAENALSIIYSSYSDKEVSTGFKNTNQIMKFLEENYTQEFPEIHLPKYNVEALSKEQEEDNIVAYYVIPAIDYEGEEKIRYNAHNSSASVDSLDFYQTLAHEGISGHMYANQYCRENFQYNIHYLLSNLGFSEGYATYVEGRSLHYLKLDKDALKCENAYMALNNAYTCLMDISVNYDGLSYKEFQKEYGDLFGNDLKDLYNTLCESPGIFMAYYYGYFTILDLRQYAQQELGDKFDNVQFNDALLRSGSVNFDIITQSIHRYIEENK